MIVDQVYAQALLLAGELTQTQEALLKVLCGAVVSSLAARLRSGLAPEACGEDFLGAASLYALAALGSASEEGGQIQEFRAGDLTVKQGSTTRDTAAKSLEKQADSLIQPYLQDRFTFLGV